MLFYISFYYKFTVYYLLLELNKITKLNNNLINIYNTMIIKLIIYNQSWENSYHNQ